MVTGLKLFKENLEEAQGKSHHVLLVFSDAIVNSLAEGNEHATK